jgi:hypothetical protein
MNIYFIKLLEYIIIVKATKIIPPISHNNTKNKYSDLHHIKPAMAKGIKSTIHNITIPILFPLSIYYILSFMFLYNKTKNLYHPDWLE